MNYNSNSPAFQSFFRAALHRPDLGVPERRVPNTQDQQDYHRRAQSNSNSDNSEYSELLRNYNRRRDFFLREIAILNSELRKYKDLASPLESI